MLLVLASVHTVLGSIALMRNTDPAKLATLVWFISGGFDLILAAFLNFARIARPADTLVRRFSVAGNFLQVVLCALVIWMFIPEIKHNPQVIVLTVVVVAETLFSLRPASAKQW